MVKWIDYRGRADFEKLVEGSLQVGHCLSDTSITLSTLLDGYLNQPCGKGAFRRPKSLKLKAEDSRYDALLPGVAASLERLFWQKNVSVRYS